MTKRRRGQAISGRMWLKPGSRSYESEVRLRATYAEELTDLRAGPCQLRFSRGVRGVERQAFVLA